MSSTFEHGYALLVGVGECSYSRWSLPATVRDMQAMHAALIDPARCAYSADEHHVRLLQGAKATRDAILDGLSFLRDCATADPDATVIVYYSGHGWIAKEDGAYYLIPYDVVPFDIPGSALSGDAFQGAVRSIAARRLLVLMDCCHAEGMAAAKDATGVKLPAGFIQAALPKALAADLKQGRGRAVFSSSGGEERSYIRPDGRLSIFTDHLLEALDGAASLPGETFVHLSHLMRHLGACVPQSAQNYYKTIQTPFFDMATEDFPVTLLAGGKGLGADGSARLAAGPHDAVRNAVHNTAEVSDDGVAAQDHSAGAGRSGVAVAGSNPGQISTGDNVRHVATGGTYIEQQTINQIIPAGDKGEDYAPLSRYLRTLIHRCHALPLAALDGDSGEGEEVTLPDIYVALDTTTVAEDEAGAAEHKRPLTALEAITAERRLTLLGDPGSGKSSFVQHLAAWLAQAYLGEVDPPATWPRGILPLILILRNAASALVKADTAVEDLAARRSALVQAIEEHWQQDGATKAAWPALQVALNEGRVLLIFDGLDEVPRTQRAAVWRSAAALTAFYPGLHRIVVTCRTRSYDEHAALRGFTVFTLAPFDREKICRFVGQWYRTQASLHPIPWEKHQARTADLQVAAVNNDLYELASNPMLLTTMAIIHQRDVGLPPSACDYTTRRSKFWCDGGKSERGIPVSDAVESVLRNEDKLRSILEQLAYMAHVRRVRQEGNKEPVVADLNRGELLVLLGRGEMLGSAGLAEEFLDYVDQRAGILVGAGGDDGERPLLYKFPHRTFQEYLAGCHVLSHPSVKGRFVELAANGEAWHLVAELALEELKYNRKITRIL